MQKSIKALGHALNGIRSAFINERNLRIEIFCAFVAITMGFILNIEIVYWLILVINICFVLTAELFNTAIEKLADVACKEINPVVKIIKDVAAAAVVMSVFSAFVCGLIIFIPSLLKFSSL